MVEQMLLQTNGSISSNGHFTRQRAKGREDFINEITKTPGFIQTGIIHRFSAGRDIIMAPNYFESEVNETAPNQLFITDSAVGSNDAWLCC